MPCQEATMKSQTMTIYLNKNRKPIYSAFFIAFIFGIVLQCFSACDQKQPEYKSISGQTMGTTYNIKYLSQPTEIIKSDIDSILVEINQDVSTYIPTSIISLVNTDSMAMLNLKRPAYRSYIFKQAPHFAENFRISKEVHEMTSGYFDPSIMPLVNYWGFGYTEKKAVEHIDSLQVEKLKALTGFERWVLTDIDSNTIEVEKPVNAELDFSAVAKGYAVDYISDWLQSKNVENFMVEIGGEVFCKGTNPQGKSWSLGLSKPEIDAKLQEFNAIITINNRALASSGNYRNYYRVGDKYYGHEINPITAYPEINTLLGCTVLADECALADAVATAFMVMGYEKSKTWLRMHPEVDAVLFFQDNNEINYFVTDNIKSTIRIIE